jgi:hypothetical protein
MKSRGRGGVFLISILLAAAWILSCGGGSDGDGDSSSAPPSTSGPTNAIEADTVDDIMQQVDELGIGCTTNGSASRFPARRDTLEALTDETVNQITGAYYARRTDAVLTAMDPIVVSSDCPGSTGEMRIDILFDDETGAFNGTLAFTNFCLAVDEINEQVNVAGGIAFNGTLGFDSADNLTSITLNANTTSTIVATAGEFSARVRFTGLAFSMSQQADGSMTLSLCWTSLDVDITDGTDSESIDADNVCLDMSISSTGAIAVTVTATITSSEGTLDVSTPTAISIDSNGNITGGVLQIDGANNTVVQITYSGFGYVFSVQADTDGDGNFDDYNEEMDCTELGNDISDMQ